MRNSAFKRVLFSGLLLALVVRVNAQSTQTNWLVVAQDGSGQFRSIQAAINSLDTVTTRQRTIFVKNGTYREKVFLGKSFVKLEGESERGVVITVSQARDLFRCAGNPDDWGAAVVNVKGHDLTFENLTVINAYGFEVKGDTTIACAGESGGNAPRTDRYALPRETGEPAGTKIVRKDGHQFAFRSFPGATRLIFKNCTFRSLGGDTVSPWDVEAGLYYFKNCTMEGAVDLYCPRGWAYAEDCRFICHNLNAAIWHDGTNHESAKTVLKNCTFEGDDGFKLGRFHREAQFHLLNCRFAKNMADADIYWVTTAPNPIKWGKRVYYYDCHREGGDYAWHRNNGTVAPSAITVAWTFDGKWMPQ